MKTFMRSILIGVCILLGYGLVEAANQVIADTIDKCYEQGSRIYNDVVDAEFCEFQKKDRQWVGSQIDTSGGSIEYEILGRAFSGDGLDDKNSPTAMMGIGNVTTGLRNQYIHCTITYIRKVHFKNAHIDDYYNLKNAIQKDDLVGESKDGYPKFLLESKREWHAVIRIKKAFSNERFAIEGNPCLINGQTMLKVPDEFKDMKFQWTSTGGNDRFDIPTAYKTTVTRQNNKILETIVSCTVFDGCDNVKKDSVKLLPYQVPESTLTFSDCLPTDATYIDVVAQNPISGVGFSWSDIMPEIASSTSSSITVRYPVSDIHNFRINLETTGGCKSTPTSKVVQRKLSNNVKLRIVDNDCLIAQHPFRVVTEPALIGWSLIWTRHPDYTIALINSNRADMVAITKNKAETGFQQIEVRDRACGGSISVIPYITALKMVVKDEKGRILQSGDTVAAGTKITFTAPKHSSITGDNPYAWGTVTFGLTGPGGMSMPLAKQWQGPAETTVTAPSSGLSISVSVSYVSCRGKESESYTIYSR